MHTTNYTNTFIEVAEDCPAIGGEVPPATPGKPTVASLQFEFLQGAPYQHTSDDVLFGVFAARQGIAKKDMAKARAEFFSKGQPCFRASPLTKRYGWGVHSEAEGRIAIYALGSKEYKKLAADASIEHVRAMRTSKK